MHSAGAGMLSRPLHVLSWLQDIIPLGSTLITSQLLPSKSFLFIIHRAVLSRYRQCRNEYVANWLTPYSWDLIEKLTVPQPLKKILLFLGTWKFTCPYIEPGESIQHGFILISSSHLSLGLPTCLFPSSFSTKTGHSFRSHAFQITCPSLHPWLHHYNIIWRGV
jgi:hypothetical protein